MLSLGHSVTRITVSIFCRPIAWLTIGIVLLAPPHSLALASAQQGVMVFDFDLKDMTLAPEVNAETKRVGSLQSMMSDALAQTHGLRILPTSTEAKSTADLGAGYIFDRPAVAVRLGRKSGARWVVSGRLYKPTHLFVYLKAQLIDVEQDRVAGDFSVEIKGAQKKLTQKGIETLALQIAEGIKSLE